MACGSLLTKDLKLCVFVGDDFNLATLSKSIKKRSENMIFSVVISFEQLSSIADTIPSNTVIVTPERISRADLLFNQVRVEQNAIKKLLLFLHKVLEYFTENRVALDNNV